MNFNWVLDSVVGQLPAAEPDRCAISFDGRVRMTYGDLRARSLRYARGMRDLGLKQGDRLGMLMLTDADYVPLYLAATRLGVITVRMNFRLPPADIAFTLGDSGCSVVIAHSSLLEKIEPIRAEANVRTYVAIPDSDDPLPDWTEPFEAIQGQTELEIEEAPRLTEEDPMALIYTSGTTGTPKGAIWNHGTTLATAKAQAMRWGFSEDTVGSVPGPLYHVGGFEAIIAPMLLVHGKGVYLSTSGFSVEHMLDVVRDEGVTDMLCFSFFLHDML